MNITKRVTWKSMWENRVRTVVTVIGILLSAAMFSAVTTLGYSLWSFLVDSQVYSTGDYFLRYDYTTQEHLEELAQDERVSRLGDLEILGYHSLSLEDGDRGYLNEVCVVAAGDAAFYDMVTVVLEEGRLPENSNELVISRNSYYYLQQSGKDCEIGDTVELEVTPEYEWSYTKLPDGVELSADGDSFTRTYTIVGIAELFTRMGDAHLDMSHLFTYADGNEGDALWHRVYVKTAVPTDANAMVKEVPEGAYAETNKQLLELYGATQYNNYNNLIGAVCAILLAIVMAGSVSLIYNAFSISVSERTKQFGLLASVGATKKQLRRCIYFEALTLSAMGVPAGILCGYVGIAVTLEAVKSAIRTVLTSTGGAVILKAVPSVWAFLAAGIVATVTVLLSAWIPALRATRISPLNAIRQVQDYKIPKQGLPVGKLSQKLWGLPGMLGRKYYTVSKKKYRATVLSITISILLFMSATSVVQVFQHVADSNANVNEHDIQCYNLTQEQLEELRDQAFVDRSALCGESNFMTVIPKEAQAADYWELYDTVTSHNGSRSRQVKELRIYYLEDGVLRDYLTELGIDPEPYFDAECPTALVYQPVTKTYLADEETGDMTLHTFKTGLFADGVETLEVYPSTAPTEVRAYIESLLGDFYYMTEPTDDRVVFVFSPAQQPTGGIITSPAYDGDALRVAVVAEEDAAGQSVYAYYLYDAENDRLDGDPIYTEVKSSEIPEFKLGAMIDRSPFGLYAAYGANAETVALILPLSAAEGTGLEEQHLSVKINDYDAATAYLTEKEILYDDLLASEKQTRDMILMINVFSYGFIILITMISVVNVFNTITTNIALRRRDFGMLRSVGMKTGELYRMMGFECLNYGCRALMWGLPLSLLTSYGVHLITLNALDEPYALPWGTLTIAVGSVFLIVFATMFYAVAKLRKDNPIDAIRMENT